MDAHQAMLRFNRRAFLSAGASGLGAAALGSLLAPQARGVAAPADSRHGVLGSPQVPPRAKRVIWMTMAGGPSHLELFDYKPKLAAMDGQPMPESMTKGQQIAQLQGKELKCFGPRTTFKPFGSNGTVICDRLEQLGSVIDDICLIRSMTTEAINHDPAHMFMNTGSQIAGRPSMGAWVVYGLGNEAEDLPGFVVLTSLGRGGENQPIAARQWSAGFLPSLYQGVHLRGKGDPVLYLSNPPGVTRAGQRRVVDTINALNREFQEQVGDPEIATRIAQYEMAFQLQASVPDLTDAGSEPAHVLEMYGCKPGDGSFASNCLLARRLAERGVRFIQLYHKDWDHHGALKDGILAKCEEIDRPCAALIRDLQQRDMLKDTLLVWAGEFGRTPMSQAGTGRDHHNKGFSVWLAGGGIKPGIALGETDDLGYAAVSDVVNVHDLHATMLHLLGIDHAQFTYKFQGLDSKLTGVEGAKVIRSILS